MNREIVYSPRGEWGYYDRGHRVLVLPPRDSHRGQIGVVTGTYNDGGDMVHHVAFDEGSTGDYFTDELKSASAIAAAEASIINRYRGN